MSCHEDNQVDQETKWGKKYLLTRSTFTFTPYMPVSHYLYLPLSIYLANQIIYTVMISLYQYWSLLVEITRFRRMVGDIEGRLLVAEMISSNFSKFVGRFSPSPHPEQWSAIQGYASIAKICSHLLGRSEHT